MEMQNNSNESGLQKRVRIYRTIFPLTILIILAVLIMSYFINKDINTLLKSKEFIVSIISLGVSLSLVMFNYLQDKHSMKPDLDEIQPPTISLNLVIKEFQQKLNKIEEQVESISKSTANISLIPEDKEKLFKYIEKSFSENINDNIFNYLERKFQERSSEIEKFQDYLVDFTSIKSRISNEIKKLNLRANTNLTIGSVTTIIAVIVLYLTVSNDKIDFTNTLSLLGHFIPRLTVVIFIEVFAFFFLKLYKTNIEVV